MNGLSNTYTGGKQVLKVIRLSFLPNVKIGVVGVNGSGKSTLLRIMGGLEQDYQGEAWVAEGIQVGYLPQEPQLDSTKNVRGNVMDGVAADVAMLTRYNTLAMNYSDETADEMGRLQDEIDRRNLWDLDARITQAMDALRCPDGDAEIIHLSGGELRRVALTRLLLEAPDLLLLDEPTNHLDAESVAWLQHYLAAYAGTVVLVTHDRYFLDNITGWILELDRGRGIPHEGNYSSWLVAKSQRHVQEARDDKARQRSLARELDWVRASPKARQAKSKARISAYDALVNAENVAVQAHAQIIIPASMRLGNQVIEADALYKGFGDKLLIDNLSFSLPAGGIVGVIGANGVGKTTLFRMLIGSEAPDGGHLRIGETVQMAYVDQSRDALDDNARVFEEISGGNDIIMLGAHAMNARAYVGAFNFRGSDQQKKIGQLSGGERNRVHLAKLLKSGGNLLLLDEPTNDLDVETLRALEDGLAAFAGSAMIISHDRWFLDRIVTHILAFEGDSHVEWFAGSYSDYAEDRRRRLGTQAEIPQRIKYKQFTR